MVYTKNAGRMQDDNLVLNDTTAAITASTLGTVGGSAAAGILDIGAVPCAFDVVIPISAMTMTTDEEYRFQIVGSTTSDFSGSGTEALLGELRLGALETLTTGVSSGSVDVDSALGTHILTARNYTADGTVYRYIRLVYHEEAGATAPSWTPGGDIYVSTVRNA